MLLNAKILNETFKPIVDPLQKLVAQKNIKQRNVVKDNTMEQILVSVKQMKVLTVIAMIQYRMLMRHLSKQQVAIMMMILICTSRPSSSINPNILTKFMEYEMKRMNFLLVICRLAFIMIKLKLTE